jgi:8-oxo-dGTP pyrophosphatase MutT (NUDIX family)
VLTSDGFAAGGLAVRARDTGRVLMIQRAHNDDDPAAGYWEFPGGRPEDLNESAEEAARREWAEETGLDVPAGSVTATWNAGVYRGHVLAVGSELDVDILGREKGVNPDDPDNEAPEAIAWWDPRELSDNPVIRPELREHPKRLQRALASAGAIQKQLVTGIFVKCAVAKSFSHDQPRNAHGEWIHVGTGEQSNIKCQNCGKTLHYNEAGRWWAHEQNDSSRCLIAGGTRAEPDVDQMRYLGANATSHQDLFDRFNFTLSDAQGVVDWHQRPAEKAELLNPNVVNYRSAERHAEQRCGSCVMYRPSDTDDEHGKCILVKGYIEADHVCDRWYGSAEKVLRRTIALNGEEIWEDQQPQRPPAAGGGAMQMPPVPGGVPGFTPGAEPPRWDGSSNQPRQTVDLPGPHDDALPNSGRVRSERPHAAFPQGPQGMDGYWPQGGHSGQQPSGQNLSGGSRSVPPRGEARTAKSDVIKVGPKGGWAYHTVLMESPERFTPAPSQTGHGDETGQTGWFTADEVRQLPLHPGFAGSFPQLQQHVEGTAGKALPPLTGDEAFRLLKRPKNLTADEQKALGLYGYKIGYKTVNPYLHHNQQVFDSDIMRYRDATQEEHERANFMTQHMDSALSKAETLQRDMIVHRRTGDVDGMFGAPGSMIGRTFVNKAYSSTTTVPRAETGYGFGYESKPGVLEIHLPAGSHVMPGNDFEHEVILPRNSKFRVVGDEPGPGGTRHIRLEHQP